MGVAADPHSFDFPHDIHALDYLAEYDMLAVQVRSRNCGDEELTAIRVGALVLKYGDGISLTFLIRTSDTTYRRAQQARFIVLQIEILVIHELGPVDGGASSTVALDEVTALEHESRDHAVEFGVLVALRLALVVLRLTGAELAEVLGGTS